VNTDAKKSVLRMIPYGIYILTADDEKGNLAVATVNWVTQTAFTFFRPAHVADSKLSGQRFRKGETGAPILVDTPGAIECRVTAIIEQGDHQKVRSWRPISVNRSPAMLRFLR
jgi:flavin reductase (DIM6/NTAB) family NADH-FMN oxidoreductase RutF